MMGDKVDIMNATGEIGIIGRIDAGRSIQYSG